jgi:MbtH protein
MTGSKTEGGLYMSVEEREDTAIYNVVINDEEQYSIWPDGRQNAPGWYDAGFQGLKADCLAYVKETWTDMRPLSLRKKMDGVAATA